MAACMPILPVDRRMPASACQLARAVPLTSCVHARLVLQESVKARHPQLLYESKLYKILQGGGGWLRTFGAAAALASMHLDAMASAPNVGALHDGSHPAQHPTAPQPASPTCAGMASRASTT